MNSTTTSRQKVKLPSKARFVWGSVIFVSGLLSPLLIPLVLSSGLSVGIKSVLSGILAFGIPELFMVIAVGILGKSGFDYIKRFLLILLKIYGPPDVVSRIRYNVGLVLFFVPVLFAFILPYLLDHITFIKDNYLIISICSDLSLVTGLFVLGGDFWDKLRGLFIRDARILFPKKNVS